ncbi:DUF1338 domain-containing protein [Vibrio sp. ZSDE26]|uniref:2-oxoadipate dioxygenase/decarboxylase n=1 Tax=Vibrio amylolyticus TaxID=2847292 RepID=A0A9X2BKR9_9VIBR|nr:DUF1338 domain-containing protein [Vibrio amylolyticus]MCK6263153.1 DUF1338 domain-containing protein [Vibrio amylolyticus]
MTPDTLFDALWNDYIKRLCPSADKVHRLLREDEALINDHIALRTFNCAPLGIATIAQPFLEAGYVACGDYEFESKKLVAKHYEHPDPKQPKVFISELKVDECSTELQQIITKLVEPLDHSKLKGHEFLSGGRLWDVSYADFQILAKESEYASWLAAHGYGANHFTVSVNQLNEFEEVQQVNDYLRTSGFSINEAGGEVKGSPDVLLEQSSTMADKVAVRFTEGVEMIPGGFYEFAKRYPMSNGELYSGFVAASADKIFESTNNE